MRSREEILFRLRQEAANAWLFFFEPEFRGAARTATSLLPDGKAVAGALRGSAYALAVEHYAGMVRAHRFPILGLTIQTREEIDWRRDYVNEATSPATYFRFVPYLDFLSVGDHKLVWELNRHQHWVLLAQAWLLTGRVEFLDEIRAQFESWARQNLFLRGINWTSALEVGFRALSWMWVEHLAGPELGIDLLDRLNRHGLFLERNLSVYFSPNTHLLGEAVALHALGAVFPQFPRAAAWRETGARLVREQMELQVRGDGSHFEQSTYYHVYALDMFLLHLVLDPDVPVLYRAKLGRMAQYLAALLGPSRRLPFLGDDDGGRLFHPYGDRDRFGRATLATAAVLLGLPLSFDPLDIAEQAAWWVGPRALEARPSAAIHASAFFEDAGIAVMTSDDIQVVIDAGRFGHGSGGHSHADTLSIVARAGDEDVLIDPGTYTYISDPKWRDWFRGTAAHNTVRVDETDQAAAAGPFRWADRPRVDVHEWNSNEVRDILDAECSYRGITHRRRVVLERAPRRLTVSDEIGGPSGGHVVEQFWHAAGPVEDAGPNAYRLGTRAVLTLPPEAAVDVKDSWRSAAYGSKQPAPVVRVAYRGPLPARLHAELSFN